MNKELILGVAVVISNSEAEYSLLPHLQPNQAREEHHNRDFGSKQGANISRNVLYKERSKV